jgi:nucleotide-binding universal stress UspA family protein
MHIKKVLAPVDFSPSSRVAVDYGVALARRLHSQLTLLHVLESPKKEVKAETEQATRLLSALIGSEDQDDLNLGIVVRSGHIQEQISSAIKETGADCVIMGTHSRGPLRRWFIGSVTLGLLRKLSVPIMTVCNVNRPFSFGRIIYATDLAESKETSFDYVLDLAEKTGARVSVVHAIDPTPATHETTGMAVYLAENRQQIIEQARTALEALAAEGHRRKVRVETSVIDGVPADVILHMADADAGDLIALAIQDKGLLERMLIGSTAERVIREAPVPVLCIPVSKA